MTLTDSHKGYLVQYTLPPQSLYAELDQSQIIRIVLPFLFDEEFELDLFVRVECQVF